MQSESYMIQEESKKFIPIQYVLDDFEKGQTYQNVKEDYSKSWIDKNPVYKNVKPRQ